jgi:peptidoglycan/LPS O-acetylase OafA/YrhL
VALFGRDRTATEAPDRSERGRTERGGGVVPSRERPRRAQSFFMRLVATAGVIGIGTAFAAILGSQDVDPWLLGLVVSALSVLLAAILWSSRTL